jgi:hypothetical protein
LIRVFISSQAVDRPPASVLISGLQAKGWAVSHSPSNPLDAEDPRWADWYERGLAQALANVEVFIAVIDDAWDSSTWMAVEADLARRAGTHTPRRYSWNPSAVRVRAGGMRQYLDERLPRAMEAAVAVVERDCAGPGAGASRKS